MRFFYCATKLIVGDKGKEQKMNILSRQIANHWFWPVFFVISRLQIRRKSSVLYVNLDAPPRLPFAGAEEVEESIGRAKKRGWVRLEKRKTGLYANGRRVVLRLNEVQNGREVVVGYKLKEMLADKPVEHPNVLDVLLKCPHLVPDNFFEFFGQDKANHASIIFWDAIFRLKDKKNLFVRALCVDKRGKFYSKHLWLGSNMGKQFPAAVRED